MSRRSKSPIAKETSLANDNRTKLLRFMARVLNRPVIKTTPVQVSYIFAPEPEIRRPAFDYVNLFEVATNSWPLRRAFRAIIQECTRNRWTRQPKFEWKCTKEDCGKEYNRTPGEGTLKEGEKPKCEVCGMELRGPSEIQARLFDHLLAEPNRDYRFDDFVRSSLFYDLSLDDWYWAVVYAKKPKTVDGKIVVKQGAVEYERIAKEIYIEDARFIYPIADKYGHLGGYQYFCPSCYDEIEGDQPVVEIRPDTPVEEKKRLIKCPYCGRDMEQTAYVQEISGVVTARWAKDELIHGSSSRVLPALFGNSKIVTVWKLVETILSMDDYNFEVYNEGKVGSMIGFPGYDQLEVGEISKGIEEELRKVDKTDIQTGRYERSKKIRTLMLGTKKDQQPFRFSLMENLKDMQSLEFYQLYANAISEVFGITPTFESSSEGGVTKIKIEVQGRTVADHQGNFEDIFNSDVLPLFNITDWVFVFNPVETRDELRLAQVHQTKAAAAFTYLRGGFKVAIGPDENLIVSGVGKLQENEPEGSRAREDRAMTGKPWRWEFGEVGGRTQGEQLELVGHVPTRVPFGVADAEETVNEQLKKLKEYAVKQLGKGMSIEQILAQAHDKAEKILDGSYQTLVNRAIAHAQKRTGKKVMLSPEEAKRLETWKENSLDDFVSILQDELKRKKKEG